MKELSVIIGCIMISVTGICTGECSDVDYTVQPIMERTLDTSFKPDGFYARYLKSASDNWITHMESLNPLMMEMMATPDKAIERHFPAWQGEYPGKLLVGAIEVYRLTGDPNLRKYIEGFISRLGGYQADDGYLNVYPKEYQMTGTGITADGLTGTAEGWCHYYLMLGFVMWYEETGDLQALHIAEKIGNLMCNKWSGNTKVLANRFDISAAHGLLRLYKVTGVKRYFDLAKEIIEVATPMGEDYLNQALLKKPFRDNPVDHGERWESFPGISAYGEMYLLTGDRKYLDALRHIWWDILKGDRHNNGGITSMEHVVDNPYDVRAVELCCTVAYISMGVELLRLTGDSLIADELELMTMNAALSFWDRSGKWMTYNTVMEGVIVPCSPWEPSPKENPGLYCCTSYAARGLGILTNWASMSNSKGLFLNWYGAGVSQAKVGDNNITIRQETDYPRTGKIKAVITVDDPAKFAIFLRIPRWSKNTRLSVNGESINVRSGKYAAVNRKWKTGDVIDIDLDMSLHYWVGEREFEGRTSIYRGPVLLALSRIPIERTTEFDSSWQQIIKMREVPYYKLMASDRPSAAVSFDFYGDRIGWRFNRFNNGGKARVEVDGKSIDVVDQYGPSDEIDLFAYDKEIKSFFLSDSVEYSGFGPGKHRITITVIDERNPASKGGRITLRDFLTEESDPVIDADNASVELLPPVDPTGPDVRLFVNDIDGRRVLLEDYDSASKNEQPFATWLRVNNPPESSYFKMNRK